MKHRVREIMADLDERKRLSAKADYDCFFSASKETQEQFYQYWLKNKDISTAPTFLKDYAKSRHF